MFSNIRVEFLPKNTTSRTQPLDVLDAGIIKTWKVYYRRKLLRYVVSQIDDKQSASGIIKSVHFEENYDDEDNDRLICWGRARRGIRRAGCQCFWRDKH